MSPDGTSGFAALDVEVVMLVGERPVVEWTERVRSEYLEMPGLTLTRPQMCRFWRLDAPLCDAVVDALVASGFLWRRPNNTYARMTNDV